MRSSCLIVIAAAALVPAACSKDTSARPPASTAPAAPATATAPAAAAPAANALLANPVASTTSCTGLAELPTRLPAAERVVAFGDVHGDLNATRTVLRVAGAIDAQDRWIGGKLVVVQTGDVLDRGDDEQAILDLFDRLTREATQAGGAFIALNGNHEIMNAAGDFRYVTPGGMADFADAPGLDLSLPGVEGRVADERARAAAFYPGGPYARMLAGRNVAVVVGDTAFVHGGILPEHAAYGLERLNRETRCWLLGKGPLPAILQSDSAPIWTRIYSNDEPNCALLEEALTALGIRRLVVGHTVQPEGINAACDGKVWRIDVGLAAFYGGSTQVLEVAGPTGQHPRVLSAD